MAGHLLASGDQNHHRTYHDRLIPGGLLQNLPYTTEQFPMRWRNLQVAADPTLIG
jgi:hypothetical protein